MPEWLIWIAGIWLVAGVLGRRRPCCGWGGHPSRLPRSGAWRWRSGREVPRGGGASRPREKPEDRLRREFVEGRLTLEEYETELWRVLGPGASPVSLGDPG